MKQQGFRNNQIAKIIGKDNRELRQNCGKPKFIMFAKEICRLVETMLIKDVWNRFKLRGIKYAW